MISLRQTSNVDDVKKFLSGNGVRNLCLGGAKYIAPDETVEAAVSDQNNVILMADVDGREMGWVAFIKLCDGMYSIHLCVKTLGQKTKQIVSEGIEFMRGYGAESIYAIYPKDRRAVNALTEFFCFKDDESALDFLAYPSDKQLTCKRLDLK